MNMQADPMPPRYHAPKPGPMGDPQSGRAVQGLGGRLVAPAVLSIIMSTFEDGSERRKALGIFAWIGGAGSVPAGALLSFSR
jgi:MFS family permease